MSEKTDNYLNLLTPFGLSPEEAEVYLFLGRKGVKSALQVSRDLKIARTKVYRILDKLVTMQLVSIQLDDMGKKFLANSYQQLELLIAEREAQTERIKVELPQTFKSLAQIWGQSEATSKVLYYSGLAGLEQVTWNSLNSKEDLRIYEVGQDMTTFLDQKFAEKVREELVERGIKTLQLSNRKKIAAYTKIKRHPLEFWEVRYIDPKSLNMQFECMVYNNVFVMYNFSGEDKFCVEIYNDKLATMQKQLFDFVWNNATKMKVLSDRGEASV